MEEAVEEYRRTPGGRLTLKGGLELSRSKKHKKKHKKRSREEEGGAAEQDEREERQGQEPAPLVIVAGKGRISTSGTTVHGHEGTQFMKQLKHGDAVIITHPTTMMDETRIVKMVLSDVSMSISSPFSSDLISTVEFRFVKAPEEEVDYEAIENQKKQKLLDTEKEAFGTYAGDLGTKFVYREKKAGAFGGYAIRVEDTADRSRTDLLEMRAGKKADRFCM
uniref:Uncharacterized protein n=1 Tax=Rhizochromulina marina TaxID=1034831 RepID=A0A7S2S051_9STRA|mmetsp:Transcript_23366/g.68232  ORF Transcript_23366/g.68232 Transcript_23366/m.68232 type:complete len:221 (+) Transcript_23366:35-697(+)